MRTTKTPIWPQGAPADLRIITKTCLYNFDPLKPHFYIVKLGFTLFFLFLLKNINCGYSLEPPRRGGSNKYPQFMFWAEIWNISELSIWKFSVFGGEIFYLYRHVFVMLVWLTCQKIHSHTLQLKDELLYVVNLYHSPCKSSRKHVYIILTPINPTFIW